MGKWEDSDDSYYIPANDFEWEMKEEMGFPYFRKYRQQLEREKEQERQINASYCMR